MEHPSRMTCDTTASATVHAATLAPVPLRYALIVFGWANVGVGIVGIFVPGLPTTVFLLLALWAFSRSSHRFNSWLYNHPRLGPLLRDWHAERVIPVRAKCLALGLMAISLSVAFVVLGGWILPVVIATVLGAVATFIVTRPSRPLR
jgi:uncharacterized membrane protein YbaN (DUF454 family)